MEIQKISMEILVALYPMEIQKISMEVHGAQEPSGPRKSSEVDPNRTQVAVELKQSMSSQSSSLLISTSYTGSSPLPGPVKKSVLYGVRCFLLFSSLLLLRLVLRSYPDRVLPELSCLQSGGIPVRLKVVDCSVDLLVDCLSAQVFANPFSRSVSAVYY